MQNTFYNGYNSEAKSKTVRSPYTGPGGKAKYDYVETTKTTEEKDREYELKREQLKEKERERLKEKEWGARSTKYETFTEPTTPSRQEKESHREVKHEKAKERDRGVKSTFYPITKPWQKEKSKILDIPLEKYLVCGNTKLFFERTPPKQTLTVRGDGNCFFRAISAVVSGSEAEHMTVRAAVTKHVSDHPDMYRTFLLSRGGMNKYLSSMKRSREWATDTEIMATATLLRTVVMVYSPCQIGGKTEYHWQTFKPLDNVEITYPVIYLSNKNEHFDPVLDVASEDDDLLENEKSRSVDF